MTNIKPSKKTSVLFYSLVVAIGVIAMTSFVFVDDELKGDALNQLINVSIMFIFPMLAVLIGVFAFVQKSQSKALKPEVLRFVTFDVMAIGLGYVFSLAFVNLEQASFKYVAYGLQLIVLLCAISIIRRQLIVLLNKLNG